MSGNAYRRGLFRAGLLIFGAADRGQRGEADGVGGQGLMLKSRFLCSVTNGPGRTPSHHHAWGSCSPLPSLPRVVRIVIVDLPTGFNHEQEKSNPNPGYRYEHDKKCFHDVAPQVRMILGCTDDLRLHR